MKDLEVLIDGKRIGCSFQQYEVFMLLWNARGRVVSEADICAHLWTPDRTPETWALCIRTLVYTLRSALLPTLFQIETKWRFGWKLVRKDKIDAYSPPPTHRRSNLAK